MEPYLVLGVSNDADFETIRAAYRRLVRENHPDVAPDKLVATTRMAQINEAWYLLGDPERRAAFDTHTRLKAFERQNRVAPPAPVPPSRPKVKPRSHVQRPKTSKPASVAKSSASKKDRLSRSTSHVKHELKSKMGPLAKSPTREARLIQKISHASQLFHRENRAEEAATLCRAVLLADGRNVAARELLGDIFAHQGRFEHAILMFDQAIQISPSDRMLRRKRAHLQQTQTSLYFTPYTAKEERAPSLWKRLRARLKGKR